MPKIIVRGNVSNCAQIMGEDWEDARLSAMRRLVEKLRPYIKVTKLPRTGDTKSVQVELDIP